MPEIVYKTGHRQECSRAEIDFAGASVIPIEDFSEREKIPFFRVGKVIFDDGVVFIEDKRE